jgi:hypothetical protein
MPPNAQRHQPDLSQPGDRIAGMFELPSGPRCPSQDPWPAMPQPPGLWPAMLSWLWQLFLEGCEAYAFGMYPHYPEPDDPSELAGPWHRAPAEYAALAPSEQSPWQFRDLAPDP